jgi:hypothetical protein
MLDNKIGIGVVAFIAQEQHLAPIGDEYGCVMGKMHGCSSQMASGA